MEDFLEHCNLRRYATMATTERKHQAAGNNFEFPVKKFYNNSTPLPPASQSFAKYLAKRENKLPASPLRLEICHSKGKRFIPYCDGM